MYIVLLCFVVVIFLKFQDAPLTKENFWLKVNKEIANATEHRKGLLIFSLSFS